jgi:hypothetical protein
MSFTTKEGLDLDIGRLENGDNFYGVGVAEAILASRELQPENPNREQFGHILGDVILKIVLKDRDDDGGDTSFINRPDQPNTGGPGRGLLEPVQEERITALAA